MTTDNFIDTSDHTKSLVMAWAVLVVLTLISYWFRDHGLSADTAVAAIIAIAFIKVYMVGMSFMELKMAPAILKNTFIVWCLASCTGLVALAFAL